MLRDKRFQFIVLFAACFAFVPLFLENILPCDMLENLYWGKEWQLGYEKHPPLFAWVSMAFFKLCGSIPESLFLLTQLNLLLGCFFVFKIAKLMGMTRDYSFASVLFFLCSGASVLGNTKFNATTILCSLLPMLFFFTLRLIKFRRMSDAVLVGLTAGGACIGKYIALVYLGVIGLFLLSEIESRNLFKTPLLYIAVAVFLLSISWHILWLFQNDLVTLQYAMDKSVAGRSARADSLKFLAMLIVFFGTSFLALRYTDKKAVWLKKYSGLTLDQRFIFIVTFAPIALLFCLSLIFGMQIGSYWGASMGMLIGVWFCSLNPDLNCDRLFSFTKKIFVVFAFGLIIAISGTKIFAREDMSRQNEIIKQATEEKRLAILSNMVRDAYLLADVRKIAAAIDKKKQEIVGDRRIDILHANKEAMFLHAYLSDFPSFYDSSEHRIRRLLDFSRGEGIHLVAEMIPNETVPDWKKMVSDLAKVQSAELIFTGVVPVIDSVVVAYAFVEVR